MRDFGTCKWPSRIPCYNLGSGSSCAYWDKKCDICDMLLLTWIELLVEQRNKIKISLFLF